MFLPGFTRAANGETQSAGAPARNITRQSGTFDSSALVIQGRYAWSVYPDRDRCHAGRFVQVMIRADPKNIRALKRDHDDLDFREFFSTLNGF
jgi:hypothetical protein